MGRKNRRGYQKNKEGKQIASDNFISRRCPHGQCQRGTHGCGNFSDELLRTNESKFCLGFISGSEGINKTKLVQHLKNKTKPRLSASAALKSVKKFLLHVDREFFRIALEPLLLYKDTGVLMHTLGEGGAMKHFIPVLAFHGTHWIRNAG